MKRYIVLGNMMPEKQIEMVQITEIEEQKMNELIGNLLRLIENKYRFIRRTAWIKRKRQQKQI